MVRREIGKKITGRRREKSFLKLLKLKIKIIFIVVNVVLQVSKVSVDVYNNISQPINVYINNQLFISNLMPQTSTKFMPFLPLQYMDPEIFMFTNSHNYSVCKKRGKEKEKDKKKNRRGQQKSSEIMVVIHCFWK